MYSSSPELPVIFCFGGQGSQYYQMGADLYAEHPVFRQWMQIGDQVVRERQGFSILEQVYGAERRISEPFDQLEASHPALFLIQYALAKAVQHGGLRPDMLLGVSLGEFTAMSLAGMFPFEQALTGVATQPEVYRQTCVPGGMIAVLGSPSVHTQTPLLATHSELVGVNSDEHFVLSAPADALDAVEAELRVQGLVSQRLPVPFAFHSQWIEPAATACRAAFSRYRTNTPYWPCWSSCTSTPVGPETPDLLWRIVREPMRVRATLEAVEAQGGAVYLDLSPSGTVAALARQVLGPDSPSRVMAIASPFGGNVKRLDDVLETLMPSRRQ